MSLRLVELVRNISYIISFRIVVVPFQFSVDVVAYCTSSMTEQDFIKCSLSHLERQISYLFHFRTNVYNLDLEVKLLTAKRDDVIRRIEEATTNDEVVRETVKAWLETVEKFLVKAAKMNGKAALIDRWFKGWVLCSRFFAGRESQMMIENVKRLLEHADTFGDRVAYGRLVQDLVSVVGVLTSNGEFKTFRSRVTTENQVIQALQDDKVSLLGIYGMPGVGKSTMISALATYVKKHELFDEVVVVKLTQTSEIEAIQSDIANGLGLKFGDADNLKVRTNRLFARLSQDRKTLIVVDNVWQRVELSRVGIPQGLKNCKVVFTTRSQDVCNSMETQESRIKLEILSPEESWDLFQENIGDAAGSLASLSVSRDVLNECRGLPLVIVALGRALYGKDETYWKDALRSLQCSTVLLDHTFSGIPHIFSVMKLSYDNLPSEEHRLCFLFCCLFPDGYHITEDQLLHYTMGENILTVKESTLQTARLHLHVIVYKLISSCLLLQDKSGCIMMHDVVRDVAIAIASNAKEGHGFIVKAGTVERDWPEVKWDKCKRLSFRTNTGKNMNWSPPDHLKAAHLSTLSFNGNKNLLEIPAGFFKEIPSLLTLDLSYTGIKVLPQSITCLVNLRALLLEGCLFKGVNLSGEFKRLEILSLRESSIQSFMASGNVTTLKLLDLSGTRNLKHISPNALSSFIKLEELYLLNSFRAWEHENKEPASSSKVNEPSEDSATSSKGIEGGEEYDIFSEEMKECAKWSEVASLSRLTSLEIHFRDRECLSRSIPHWENLLRFKIVVGEIDDFVHFETSDGVKLEKSLSIKLDSTKVANWVKVLLGRTELLQLRGSLSLGDLVQFDPSWQQLTFRELRVLMLWENESVTSLIDCDELVRFQNLNKLEVINCSHLRRLIEFNVEDNALSDDDSDWSRTTVKFSRLAVSSVFPKLTYLKVSGCFHLKFLFPMIVIRLLSQLEELYISNCYSMETVIEDERLEYRYESLCARMAGNDRVILPKLRILSLESLRMLRSFVKGNNIGCGLDINWLVLEELTVKKCLMLIEIPHVHSSPRLAKLMVDHDATWLCLLDERLSRLLNRSSRPEHIHLTGEMSLKVELLDQSYSALRSLTMKNCEVTNLMPCDMLRRFPNLERLVVDNCVSLEKIIDFQEEEKDTDTSATSSSSSSRNHYVKKHELFDEVVVVKLTQTSEIEAIQSDIANGLGLKFGDADNLKVRTNRLFARLSQDRKTLIVVDNVWQRVELSRVGIPQGLKNCKVVFTTRSQDVCNSMETQESRIKLEILSPEESWDLFQENIGDAAGSLASLSVSRDVLNECRGLPLVIVALGRALYGKDETYWKDALRSLQCSTVLLDHTFSGIPHIFSVMKLSYDNLPSEEHRLCFLFCCLFPDGYHITEDQLLHYTMGENILTVKESTLQTARLHLHVIVYKLISSCLLLQDKSGCIMMHDVVRDVAIAIASNAKEGHGFIVKAGTVERDWPEVKWDKCKRLSFRTNTGKNMNWSPPDHLKAAHLSTLSFNGNKNLLEIPAGFFKEIPSLLTLDLSYTGIKVLPQSITCLVNLRALLLEGCLFKGVNLSGEFKRLEILSLRESSIQSFMASGTRNLKHISPNALSSFIKLEELYLLNSFRAWEHENKEPASSSKVNEPSEDSATSSKGIEGGEEYDIFSEEMKECAKWSEVASLSRLTSLEIHFRDRECLSRSIPHWENLLRFKIVVGEIDDFVHFETSDGVKLEKSLSIKLDSTKVANWVKVLLGRTELLQLRGSLSLGDLVQFDPSWQQLTFRELRVLMLWENESVTSLIDCDELVRFQNLNKLEVINCSHLRRLIEFNVEDNALSDDDSDWSRTTVKFSRLAVSSVFPKLTYLKVSGCFHLKFLFPMIVIRLLSQLEELYISNCYSMETVIEDERLEYRYESLCARMAGNDRVILPKLRILSLESLRMLRSFVKGNNIGCGLDINWLVLEELTVKKCLMLIEIPHVHSSPRLAKLMVDHDATWLCLLDERLSRLLNRSSRPEHIHLTGEMSLKVELLDQSYSALRSLTMKNCEVTNLMPCDMLRRFPNLERLVVDNCVSLEKIIDFQEEEKDTDTSATSSSSSSRNHYVKKHELFDEVVVVKLTQTSEIEAIQSDIANGLGLKFGDADNLKVRTNRLFARLSQDRKTLIVVDNVWQRVELSRVGIPQGLKNCKVVFTTRSQDVCNSMETQESRIKLEILSPEESWDLFQENIGDAAGSLASLSVSRDVLNECRGLPLVIVALGRALYGKDETYWKDALRSLQCSTVLLDHTFSGIPHIFSVMKLSYDNLPSEEHRLCFLFCCLFPDGYHITEDQLLHYTMGENILTVKESTLQTARLHLHVIVYKLISSCLLLQDKSGCIMMHDVVRDVAIAIASNAKEGHGFIVKAGTVERDWPEVKWDKCKRLSFRTNTGKNMNWSPPDHLKAAHLSTLSFNGNKNLLEIPAGFFKEIPSLLTLDLSYTGIKVLPQSITCLVNLRALLLEGCLFKGVNLSGEFKRLEILSLRESSIQSFMASGTRNLKHISPNALSSFIKLEELYLLNSFRAWEHENKEPASSSKVNEPSEDSATSSKGIEGGEEYDIFSEEMKECAKWSEVASLSRLTSLEIHFRDRECLSRSIPHWENLLRFKIVVGEIDDFVHFETSDGVKLEKSLSIKLDSTKVANWVKVLLGRTELLQLRGSLSLGDLVQFDPSWQQLTFRELRVLMLWENESVTSLIDCDELVRFQNLNKLEVINCSHLRRLIEFNVEDNALSDDDSDWSRTTVKFSRLAVSSVFPKLTYLKVSGCFHLKFLFPMIVIRLLSQLEELYISNCYSMETVIEDERLEYRYESLCARMAGNDRVILPKLRILSLESLRMLRSFVKGNNIGCGLDINWLVLEELTVKKCLMLIEIPHVHSSPRLAKLMVDHDATWLCLLDERLSRLLNRSSRPEHIHLTGEMSLKVELLDQSYSALRSLTMKNCEVTNLMPCDMLRRFPNLERLVVDNCVSLEKIIDFQEEEKDTDTSATSSSSSSRNHYEFSKFPPFLVFLNLTSLRVYYCNSLKYLLPMSTIRGMLQLKRLVIWGCNAMETIITHESVEDDGDADRDKEVLPRLETLALGDLPMLSNFVEKDILFDWPSLTLIWVSNCLGLKKLPLGPGSVPKLENCLLNPREWSGELEWEDEEVKSRVQRVLPVVNSEVSTSKKESTKKAKKGKTKKGNPSVRTEGAVVLRPSLAAKALAEAFFKI